MKKLYICLLLLFLSVGITGCSTSNNQIEVGNGSNKIRINGSTSMEKLVNGLAEVMRDKSSNIIVEPQFTGSSAGIEALSSGTADIASSSRSLKDSEIQKGLVENIVALDGIVVITNPSNTVVSLNKEQLIAIYTGKINNWQEVGGLDQKIVLMGREAGSGSRGSFEQILGIEDNCKYAQELNETGAVVGKVGSIEGAIGYVSLDVINDTVKPLRFMGIMATHESIRDGSYVLQRPFVMATKGEISEQSTATQSLFAFIYSDEGQRFITSIGLVSAR